MNPKKIVPLDINDHPRLPKTHTHTPTPLFKPININLLLVFHHYILGPIRGGIWKAEYLLWVLALMGCMERLEKNTKWEEGWCCHFWPDWHYSLQHVIHSKREEQVPPLLLPAQVYDNPNKLWCAAQTLKTVIGTKSNRLCLSGQRELREGLCVYSFLLSLPTINFFLSSNLTSLQGLLPMPLFPRLLSTLLLAQLVIFHYFFSVSVL